LKASDLASVQSLVKGEGGCGYFKDHDLSAYLDESDEKHVGYGVEHTASGQIICAQFILMVDGNETGYVLGAMFEPKYKSSIRICYTRLSNDIQDKLSTKYDNLGKHRSVCIVEGDDVDDYCNNGTLDWKIKFNLDAMTDATKYYLYNRGGDDVDEEDGVKVNGDFTETEDVEVAIKALTAFGVENVVIDWKMYQTQYLKEELTEMKVGILVNKEESALVVVYGGSDYYVYGKSPKEVLSGIRFALSQSSDADLGVFVSKAMVGDNAEIQKLFGKAMKREIVGLDYDMHIDGH